MRTRRAWAHTALSAAGYSNSSTAAVHIYIRACIGRLHVLTRHSDTFIQIKMMPMNSLASTVVPIRDEEDGPSSFEKKRPSPLSFLASSFPPNMGVQDPRKLLHGFKVGIALVLVSFLYLLEPLYVKFGDNAMWAIMTVVVVFEFSAGEEERPRPACKQFAIPYLISLGSTNFPLEIGQASWKCATLSKGLNRGMGTILGGALGCLSALIAQRIGGIGKAIAIGISVFIFGAAASFFRLNPNIKKKFEYGVLIFILTFNLVAVSGVRGEEIVDLAKDRLTTILIGFGICVFTSMFVFPVWASDELHRSLVSKFNILSLSIEECMKEYFKALDDKTGMQSSADLDRFMPVLHSKSSDETLANFARWEPWHGRFGFFYPWNKYLIIGESLRELAATSPECLRSSIKEPCEAMGALISSALKEFGEHISDMKKFQRRDHIVESLKAACLQVHVTMSTLKFRMAVQGIRSNYSISEELAMATFVFMLMEMGDKVEKLVKEVEELGEIAQFIS
ncbi:hypothetical protein ACLOJK_025990 [Asimina triloba]